MNEPDQNPYAPGAAAPGAPVSSAGAIVPGDFDIGEAFSLTFEVLRRHWLMGSVGFLIFIVISMAASFATTGLEYAINLAAEGVGTIIGTMINYVAQIPIGFGGTWLGYMAVKQFHKNQDVNVEAVFRGFKSFAPILVVSLLQLAAMVVVILPGVLVSGGILFAMGGEELLDSPENILERTDLLAAGGVAFLVLTILPALYISVRLYFAGLICVERDRTGMDALKDSWTLTRDATWKLIGFFILWSLLILVASPLWILFLVLTCGIGLLPFGFLQVALTGVVYDRMTK